MVSDSELAEYLGQMLRTADLTTTTNAILRKQLEEHFGVDLSGKRAFIREQVDLYIQNLDNDAEEGADEAKEDEEAGKDAQNGNDSDRGKEAEEGDENEEEEEDGDGNDEDDNGSEGSDGKSRKKKGSNISGKDVKRKAGGFTKLCSLSPQLQNLLGEAELARTEVVKRIWAYIRKHDLQDPSNKRIIICDAKLNPIFNVKSIDMFQMNKTLAKHIWPLDSVNSTVPKDKEGEKEKKQKQGKRPKKREDDDDDDDEDEEDEPSKKEKRRKTGTTGFLAPLPISDALSKFVGTGVTEMSRADVVKTIWQYIKENKLQDPSDKRRIICDSKLKELFEVDSFHGFTVAKLLGPHFIKSEK